MDHNKVGFAIDLVIAGKYSRTLPEKNMFGEVELIHTNRGEEEILVLTQEEYDLFKQFTRNMI
jgi:hypothetical protein